MDPTSVDNPAGFEESQDRRRHQGVYKALRLFFAALAFEETARLETLIAEFSTRLPDKCSPTGAVSHASRLVDKWLGDLTSRLQLPFNVALETRRAALINMKIGRHWPLDFLHEQPSAEFLQAFLQALPIAQPPEQPLEMPEQSLSTWQPESRPATGTHRGHPGLRRFFVLGLGLISTGAATHQLYKVFERGDITTVEIVLMVLFALNFMWIAITFWSALAGLGVLIRRGPTPGLKPLRDAATPLRARTVVLMPTYNEAPARIFAALEAIYCAIEKTGQLAAFEFFVLSDTTDPDVWIAEEQAWDVSRRKLGATGRFFYRRRFDNYARKAGNIAEFCRRWGGRYEHMLVLDADSLMAGETIVRMAQLMEANPATGILQTVPRLVNRNTLFARAQQFAGALYGPVMAAGLGFWHLGDSNYWGHNAIIRVRAFTGSAGLPVLKGRPPFGGHILSHDFVEAALIRRAGWRVHLLADLSGSYEESPPSLIDHAQRDRRWCQGNLQHMAVIGASGLHPLSRIHIFTGIMSYLASPLWFIFILVGIFAALQGRFQLPVYFFPSESPYPVWHIIDPVLAARLFWTTMAVLLAPKLFGLLSLLTDSRTRREFGGFARAAMSVLIETFYSALVAPVQMLFQTRFVIDVFLGHDSGWRTQTRDDRGIPWREVYYRHRWHTLAGILLGVAAYAVYPALLAWMSPAVAGMVLAIPSSYLGARLSVGLKLRHLGLLQIPEETAPPPILVDAAARLAATPPIDIEAGSGLRSVVYDNRAGVLHLALLAQDAPKQRTEAMMVARYRVASVRSSHDMDVGFDLRQQAAALADRQTVLRLRRVLGKFR